MKLLEIRPELKVLREEAKNPVATADLITVWQNARQDEGRESKAVLVTRSRNGLRFRIYNELPHWAREHVDSMNAQAEAEELASRRARGEFV